MSFFFLHHKREREREREYNKIQACFLLETFLLQIFAPAEGFVKACPLGLTDYIHPHLFECILKRRLNYTVTLTDVQLEPSSIC